MGRKLTHKIKRMRNKFLMWIAKHTIPTLYVAYMKFVWKTSKIIDGGVLLEDYLKNHEDKRVSCLLWHQDAIFVAWSYRHYQGITIASKGDSGEIISRLLTKCGYHFVWRGGSSKSKKHKAKILDEFLRYYKVHADHPLGLTVDGSSGPVFHCKHGGIVIAQQCNCPIMLWRIWPKKKIFLPTWDRMVLPAPFNTIRVNTVGPYYVSPDLTPEELEQKRAFIENELLELAWETAMEIDGKIPPALAKLFPEGWTPQWKEGDKHCEERPVVKEETLERMRQEVEDIKSGKISIEHDQYTEAHENE